ncbi:hypothetical protein [Algisphaera agarilytica]|uniref:Uncharacterized protein n=1 Tax=Algisphaera agarilytica TaxID=1385975 RepID=A0A7X0H3N3_9BACT|nr:hypothetical protein [Algisphaera agarilytica]MBB6428666.1 hypothetical protein [Algisphaera agarilytica]
MNKNTVNRWLRITAVISILLFVGFLIRGLLFDLKARNSLDEKVASQSQMKQIYLGLYVYFTDYQSLPPSLSYPAFKMYMGVPNNAEFQNTPLANPRKGFQTYYLRQPKESFGQLMDSSDVGILFEVRDDETVAYESGVIGYADGHVKYHEESETD